ncbi:MAG: hypothetical protein IJR85_00090, partial [Synergistaceae bacterium]|nr:hypothetical protein [Synergistaceae bacterium]
SEVTVICCWNDEKMYGDFVNTLKTQDCPYELIGIDNRGNGAFKSCAAAYNSVINQVKTKYVVYSHQDILLTASDMLAKFTAYLGKIGNNDIIGVAGVRFDTNKGYSNIMHRVNRTGELVHGTSEFPENGMIECDTVDECFFGGYAQHFADYPFDEIVCDNWHLYAAEACLRTKSNNAGGAGGHVWVCDVPLFHRSSGTISPAFQYGFYKLCRKYAPFFPFIKTTSGAQRTDFMHLFPRFAYLWCHSMAGVIFRKLGIYETMKRIFH